METTKIGQVVGVEEKLSTGGKLSTGPRTCARGLDVDGNINIQEQSLRPRAREELRCTWIEACQAADFVLENFGNRQRDRGIWVWYCQRIGLNSFLDIAYEVISSCRQGEIKWPVRAFQKHLKEAFPLPTGGTK